MVGEAAGHELRRAVRAGALTAAPLLDGCELYAGEELELRYELVLGTFAETTGADVLPFCVATVSERLLDE